MEQKPKPLQPQPTKKMSHTHFTEGAYKHGISAEIKLGFDSCTQRTTTGIMT